MQTIVSNFNWTRAHSLSDALDKMASNPDLRPFAGGTDLMVEVEAGVLTSGHFIDINELDELRFIATAEDRIELGALTTYTDLIEHDLIRREFPMLALAGELTAAPAIQNRGTLGGNIVNASPAADTPPALLAYDATLVFESRTGRRSLSYAELHTGYKTLAKKSDELLVAIHLPRYHARRHTWYKKVGTRQMQAISKVVFAGSCDAADKAFSQVRLAFGSVAPTPIRAHHAEAYLEGKTLDEVDENELARKLFVDVKPIDDVRSQASYREKVALNIVTEFLKAR